MTPAPTPRRAITARAVLLGFCGVVLICGLTPYNDYALNNTFLVGNNLPLVAVMLLFGALLINAPVNRYAPRYALDSGELCVAFTMALVSCSLPSSGLMRYLPNVLVVPLRYAGENKEFADVFDSLHLRRWLFPTFRSDNPSEWPIDPVVTGYVGRWTGPGPAPYVAWVVPVLAWGIFLGALYGALTCMVAMLRRQWFENERLPLPLAQIELAMIERPAPGRWFNDQLGRRSFWIAFAAVFLLHVWRGLARYQPAHFPDIPVGYDLSELMGSAPWMYTEPALKKAVIFFTVVGVTYFIPSNIAFSLWFFFIAWMGQKIWLGLRYGDNGTPGEFDEHTGALAAWAIAILWVGRRHWRVIVAQAFRGERAGEPRGRYLSYPSAFWGFVACTVVMVAWLTAAGAQWWAAAAMVLVLLALFMIITRIVAETGLIHGQLRTSMVEPWSQISAAGWGKPVSNSTYYLGLILNATLYDHREPMPVYASHGVKLADQTMMSDRDDVDENALRANRKSGRRFVMLIGLALFVGYFVSFGSTLWTEYHFASTKDVPARTPINEWGADGNIREQVVKGSLAYERQRYQHPVSTVGHLSFGFLFTAFLSFMRLRFTWWPLHPVGYIMIGGFPSNNLWFSILLGWLVKGVILRLGGSRFYTSARPFFLGLIVGESMAAGFWLLTGIVLSTLNLPYRAINIMPQ